MYNTVEFLIEVLEVYGAHYREYPFNAGQTSFLIENLSWTFGSKDKFVDEISEALRGEDFDLDYLGNDEAMIYLY